MADRVKYGKLSDVIDLPDLIEIQTTSYRDFLQMDAPTNRRKLIGLQAVFKEVFPIESYDGQCALDFVKYEISEPKMSPIECLREGHSYSAPLYVTFRLRRARKSAKKTSTWRNSAHHRARNVYRQRRGARRGEPAASFPGHLLRAKYPSKRDGSAFLPDYPDRGSWIEVQFDTSDLLQIYLDRKKRRRKFLATTFLRALGFGTDEELLGIFYTFEKLSLKETLSDDKLVNRVVKDDIIDADSQSILARKYDPLTSDLVKQMKSAGFHEVEAVNVKWDEGIILKSVKKDPTHSMDDALKDIYHRLRPGDPPTISNAKQLLKRVFFDPRRYDLGRVGRYKIQQKMGLDAKNDSRVLEKEDLIASIKYLVSLRRGEGTVDDIDHLGSRRVRTVGELVEINAA